MGARNLVLLRHSRLLTSSSARVWLVTKVAKLAAKSICTTLFTRAVTVALDEEKHNRKGGKGPRGRSDLERSNTLE